MKKGVLDEFVLRYEMAGDKKGRVANPHKAIDMVIASFGKLWRFIRTRFTVAVRHPFLSDDREFDYIDKISRKGRK